MAAYVAMAPGLGRRADAVLVRDSFRVLAFLLPVPWLLWHRMWIEALAALAVSVALAWLERGGGFGVPLASLLVGLLIGWEAPTLRLWKLRRRGWREIGTVEAGSARDAETRLFLALDDGEADAPLAPRPPSPDRRAGPALGFLDRRGIVG